MSTSSHQLYLRRISKETDSTIFTIDYPKAPFAKYFDIFNICLKFYLYVNTLVELLDVQSWVVAYGDSAGGTLISSLNIWAISCGYK